MQNRDGILLRYSGTYSDFYFPKVIITMQNSGQGVNIAAVLKLFFFFPQVMITLQKAEEEVSVAAVLH